MLQFKAEVEGSSEFDSGLSKVYGFICNKNWHKLQQLSDF